MMKRTLFTAFAAAALLANTSWAQVDLGGAISGAINGATGNTQAATQAATQGTIQPPQAPNATPPKAAIQAGADSSATIAPGTATAGGNTTAGVNAAAAGINAQGTARVNGQGTAGINSQGVNASSAVGAGSVNQTQGQQTQGQGWLGQVGNDIRGALQQADNGVMRLQNTLNPSLQQRGFQPGDQLLDNNGQPLTQAQFDQYLQSNPGQVRVLRNGQTVVINGNVQGNMQGNRRFNQQSGQQNVYGAGQVNGRQRFGITMNQSAEGVQVVGVTVGSPAAQAGIRPGDQIIAVNDTQIADPNSMIQAVAAASDSEPMNVQYRRNGEVMRAQVSLASTANAQGGVYQAGYPQSQPGFPPSQPGYSQGSVGGSGAHADMNARIDQLERAIQDLRDQVEKLSQKQ